MKNVVVVYVKATGVLGLVTHFYPDGAIDVFYYVDGLSYDTTLDPEEFELRAGQV